MLDTLPVTGQALESRRVALGIGGGIAAYKCCDLVRALTKHNATVRVAMTRAATQFVTPLTLEALSGAPVDVDPFARVGASGYAHLELARWAELFIIAPATADLIARIHAGLADDAVTTPLLAFSGPVLLAPAMNTRMWENPVTQRNVRALLADPRFTQVGPSAGALADGDVGMGRLAEVSALVEAAARALAAPTLTTLKGRRVLVTAGPTREHLDPVRFLSNPSSGKMGLAIAQVAAARGAEVTVVLGPVSSPVPQGLVVTHVVSAEEMAREVLARVEEVDYFIATAAVSDFRPKVRAEHKVKKESEQAEGQLPLVRTPDVLAQASRVVHARPRRPVLIGFAAETQDVLRHARAKLQAKQLDCIVANDVSAVGRGFGSDDNEVEAVFASRPDVLRISGTKRHIAEQLWDAWERLCPEG